MSEQTKTNLESELRIYETNLAELNEKLSRAEEKVTQLACQKEKLVRYSNLYYYLYPYSFRLWLNYNVNFFIGSRNF